MAPVSGILRLSNELLRDILDHIEADPDKLVNLDRRSYLSQESFALPPPPSRDQAQDIANFRLVCKAFAELGVIHQFARVTTRFSRKGFERLENIASQPQLAKHVKKFSYMVPFFYVEGRDQVGDLPLPNVQSGLGALDVSNFESKVAEQKTIVRSERDAIALRKAFTAFTSLQHVQILRVQDRADGLLLGYIRQHHDLRNFVELDWAPACSHSTRTIGAALMKSQNSPCSRFSSPMLSPQSLESLAEQLPRTFRNLVNRLTSLELHFDDGTDLDNRMKRLSGLFRTVCTAAENMVAIHIGFPSHRPLSLPLEDIFHHVKWEKLSAFGIQAWRLDEQEIIAFARRHREKLRGLRLRDVLLKDSSMWKHVLGYLRDDMVRLDWVSLRRIGYAKHFDEQWAAAGVEVPDDPPGGASDSDSEDDFDGDSNPDRERSYNGDDDDDDDDDDESDTLSSADDDDFYDSDEHSDDDDEHGPDAHEMDFPSLSPDTPSSAPWCNCNGRSAALDGIDQLGDDGVSVSNVQRKMWEKWVVRRCPEHSTNRR